MLQIEEGDHAHKSVAMQTAPGSPFEVIEAKFLLELLMGLLAEPARLDGGGEDFQRRLGRQAAVIADPGKPEAQGCDLALVTLPLPAAPAAPYFA